MDRFEWVRSKAEGKILEVGSANGALFANSGLDVHYCDINEFPLPNFTVADAHNLPFPDNSFTTVCVCELLEHVRDPLQVLREAARVASKRVIFTVPFEYLWTSDKLPLMSFEDRMKQDGLTKEEEYKQGNPTVTRINSLDEAWHRRWFTRASLEELLGQLQLPYTSELLQYEGWAFLVGEIKKPSSVEYKQAPSRLKIMVISTTVYALPPKGYSGLEALAYAWSCEFAKQGHQVSVVAPEGSVLPVGIELIPTPVMVDESEAYPRYKDRLGEFDVIMDNSWLWYTVIAQMEADKQLPVVHIFHSDPDYLPSPPPIKYPCLIGLSKDHARRIKEKWGASEVKFNYNGVPLDFYQFDPSIQRNGRWLWCARYHPDKACLEAIQLAKKCNVPLDLYGNTLIIRSQDYLNQCMAECDANDVVFHLEVPREETVKLYQTHKALIHLVNFNEAFGLVPVEAMATGCPVIVNRRGALPELIEDGVTGFVVDTIEQAEEIIKSDKVDSIKAEDCRKRAEMFSIEASARGYLELFREVVNGRVW